MLQRFCFYAAYVYFTAYYYFSRRSLLHCIGTAKVFGC